MNRINSVNFIGEDYECSHKIMICDDEPFNVQGLVHVLKAAIKKMGCSEKLVDDLVDKCYNG